MWVVGVGASAGGLEALGDLLREVTPDIPACFIVAQHLAPHARSMMVELIDRQTELRVKAVEEADPLTPGTVYIVPPNHDVTFQDGLLHLTVAGEATRPKPSVDLLLSSLAEVFGARAIGVILSGTGTDGAEGIIRIKEAGGVTLVQEEKSAKYDGMPRAAIETGRVDYILSAVEMGSRLREILKSQEGGPLPDQESDLFRKILASVRKEIGTDFSQYKVLTLQRRLARRISMLGLSSLEEYHSRFEADHDEARKLAQELLVGVTAFFRDEEAFEKIAGILNEIVTQKKETGDEVRIWCAGCATGEEAFTLAILLCEAMDQQKISLPAKIFATDLDQEAILHGRNGLYSADEVSKVPEELRARYFEPRGGHFEVRKRIRDLVVFARQDLTRNPPFVKLDLVTCRNVMIYFDSPLQRKIFEIFHYSLRPEGRLFLGKSESIGMAAHLFETLDRKNKIYLRKESNVRVIPSAAQGPNLLSSQPFVPKRRLASQKSLAERAQSVLLERHQITGVVVDEEGMIHAVVGDASSFLKVSRGLTEFRLQNLLPEEISVETHVLLRKVARTKSSERGRTFQIENGPDGSARTYQIVIGSFEEGKDGSEGAQFLVSFERVKEITEVVSTAPRASDSEMSLRVAELEEELAVTREHLQTVIEELGVSNEELQSVNEELSSTNEELQASNEELETTNEEFQSTNEELTTLNEELNIKTSELNSINTALENVQDSIRSPLVVVDRDLRIIRYNSSARDIFEIGVSDSGVPITHVSCRVEIPEFEKSLKQTIDTGHPNETIVHSSKLAYQMRILPCRDQKSQIEGATIIFFDNTQLIRAEEKLRQSELRNRIIMDGSTTMIFLKDAMGRYLLVNREFLRFFNLKEEDVLGRTDRELFPDRLANGFRNGDLEALLKNQRVERTEVIQIGGRTHHLLMSRFPLTDGETESPHSIGCVATDISAQYEAQENLHRSEALYRALVEEQSVFVARFKAGGEITFLNSAFRKHFVNISVAALRDFLRCVDPAERPRINQEMEALTPAEPVAQVDHKTPAINGSSRWVRWILKGLFEEDGSLSEIQAVGFDITDYRVQSEQMLQREALFSQIFNYTSDQISVYRVEDGTELFLESFNRGFEQGSSGQASYSQYIGRNLKELLSPEKRNDLLKLYQKCIDRRESQTFDEEVMLQGGTKYFVTTLIPVVDSEGGVERVVSLSRDVSRFKRVEVELKQAKDAAEIASAAKSDFLASMSHELRTPLNVVIGMSQLLETANLSEDERKQVESIQKSGRLLLTLIEDILDLSRIEAGKVKIEYTNFSLQNLIQEVIENFELQAASKKVKLFASFVGFEDRFQVIGDPTRIRQVVLNLVGNAVKFTDEGSVEIKVIATNIGEGGRRNIRFEVRDTGIGIPRDSHHKIFQKFSQVDSGLSRRYGGTGLGLVISRRLVSLMHGDIGFESERGKGSLFWFELVLSTGNEPSKAPKNVSAPSNGSISNGVEKIRILAVDDSPESQVVLKMFLKRLGLKADCVNGGRAAIEKIKENDYDLILMDVQMPEMDGYQTTSAIRRLSERGRQIPIVAVTANAMVGDSERCFEAGMNDYMTKPFDLESLRQMIEKWAEEPT